MSRGVVAAGHALTARAAAEILREGGNAFDAAIAGMVMATVAEAALASLGGGGFLMARTAAGKTRLYDFFVQTPLSPREDGRAALQAIHADFGTATQEFHIGFAATATPGIVPGLFAIHADLARLPLPRLFAPAIAAAEDGVVLTAFQAYVLTVIAPILTASAGAAAIFAPEGRLLREGEKIRNPDLAETLSLLAEQGEALFVTGAVGEAIVEQSEIEGGHLTHADLASYHMAAREPLHWRHCGAELSLNPPPAASGALIAYALSRLDRSQQGRHPTSADLVRALAAANRAREAADAELDAIVGSAAPEAPRLNVSPPAYRGTTHLSVIDGDGNVAALSLSNGEGNGHIVDGFGVMLNNMLGEADLVPAGVWPEGVRLSSMMAPTIVEGADGSLTALGTGGSNRIRSAVLQVVLNLVDRGMTLAEAVAAPRLHLETCGTLSFEPGIAGLDAALAEAASAQAWPAPNLFFGGVHAVRREADGRLSGAGDPRRDGVAMVVD